MGSLSKRMDTVEEVVKKMNYICLDLETKSCRSNLLFNGISKMDDECNVVNPLQSTFNYIEDLMLVFRIVTDRKQFRE